MFSGLIEGTGVLKKIERLPEGARLEVKADFSLARTKLGDSIAVNGCCLTVTRLKKNLFAADLSSETLAVTNLSSVKPGDLVNLERPLRLQDRLGGHLVQGHVDGLGQVVSIKRHGLSWEVTVSLPKNLRRFVIPKGSITVDGISMTVNELKPEKFTLVVIPHTRQMTNLKAKRVGDPVNLEVDMIGKYIESLENFKSYGSVKSARVLSGSDFIRPAKRSKR